MKEINTKKMVLTAIMTALVFVGSRIGIHTPSVTGGGYVHLGTAFMFAAAFLLGKKSGAFAGGIGMGLFDLLSEYSAWAPFTFIISLAMGYFAGEIAYYDGKISYGKMIFAIAVCTIIKVAGYYATEAFILGNNLIAPLTSIPGNITQMVLGGVVGILLTVVIVQRKIKTT